MLSEEKTPRIPSKLTSKMKVSTLATHIHHSSWSLSYSNKIKVMQLGKKAQEYQFVDDKIKTPPENS